MRHLTRKRKANKKIIRRDTKATVQRYKVWNKEEIISSKDLSKSSKLILFLSLQIVQKMQVGIIFHTVAPKKYN
jgi:hypothetical protein